MARERLHVVSPHRGAALSKGVDVGDAAQRIEAVHRSDVGRFPNRPFRRLAIAQHHVCPVVGLDTPGIERRTDGGADALTQRAGGDVHKRQPWSRVTLEIRSDLAKVHQLASIERTRFGPQRVQDRRGVALRQHEPVSLDVMRVFRIEPHLREEERRQQVGGGAARRGMSAARFGCRLHRVDPEPRGNVSESRDQNSAV